VGLTLNSNHYFFSGSKKPTNKKKTSCNDEYDVEICSDDDIGHSFSIKDRQTKFSNLIVAYATIPHFISKRHKVDGSHYIQRVICNLFITLLFRQKSISSNNTIILWV
jgi:hypothetical protein